MKFIWTMPWSAVKCISFFIRYSFLPFMIITIYGEYVPAVFQTQTLISHRKRRYSKPFE